MPDSPLALVTCGPAHEPIDSVRRITNFSSGELGVFLCDALRGIGFRVKCLRGEMATVALTAGTEAQSFSTNNSLAQLFQEQKESPAVIFHAAALCDYLLAEVEGVALTQKIRSDASELRLTLRPATKLLPELPRRFPNALIVGWKYELDGSRGDAIERGRNQIIKAGTSASVVNGAAYGPGFGFLTRESDSVVHYLDKKTLSSALAEWAWLKVRR